MQQYQQSDYTKSHVIKPTSAKQIGSNNVQNNRAHGIGSGIGHRASDTPNMVKFIAFHCIVLQWRQPHKYSNYFHIIQDGK